MKNIILLSILSLIILSCCSDVPKSDKFGEMPAINLDSLMPVAKSDTPFKTVKSIQLESTQGSLIGSLFGIVDGIRLKNDTIYVLDKRNNIIFLFDLDGNFLFKINRSGRGPGEYLAINDFLVKDGFIYILETERIFVYDQNGEYTRTIELPFRARYFEYIEDSLFVFQNISIEGVAKYSVGIYSLIKNKLVNTLEVIENINDDSYPFWWHKHLFHSQGGIYYNGMYSNKIYKIGSDKIKPAFEFFSKNFPKKEEILRYNQDPESRYKDGLNKIFHLSAIFENHDYLTFQFRHNIDFFQVIYNKEKKKLVCFKNVPAHYGEYNGMFLSIRQDIRINNLEPNKEQMNPVVTLSVFDSEF